MKKLKSHTLFFCLKTPKNSKKQHNRSDSAAKLKAESRKANNLFSAIFLSPYLVKKNSYTTKYKGLAKSPFRIYLIFSI